MIFNLFKNRENKYCKKASSEAWVYPKSSSWIKYGYFKGYWFDSENKIVKEKPDGRIIYTFE
jgi:hypothetical protein